MQARMPPRDRLSALRTDTSRRPPHLQVLNALADRALGCPVDESSGVGQSAAARPRKRVDDSADRAEGSGHRVRWGISSQVPKAQRARRPPASMTQQAVLAPRRREPRAWCVMAGNKGWLFTHGRSLGQGHTSLRAHFPVRRWARWVPLR